MYRARASPRPMPDPPAGAPEATPTNTPKTTKLFSSDRFQPSLVPRKSRQPRHSDKYTSTPRSSPEFASNSEPTRRVTTREVRQLIDDLKEIIHHQTTLIQANEDELHKVKHNQNVLLDQNEKLLEEIRTLRTQVETHPPTSPNSI